MKKTYIVVDDDKTNNLICHLTINKFEEDAKIQLFTEPEEGIAWIEKNYFSKEEPGQIFLFLDINMPTMTGWEFLDHLNSLKGQVKNKFCIYILSSSIEDFSAKALEYPFVSGFLSKPLSISHLEKICN